MGLENDSFVFFVELLALFVVAVPAYRMAGTATLKKAVAAAAGALLLFIVAPRVLLLYLLLWSCVWGGQAVLAALPDRARLRPLLFFVLLAAVLAPMVLWKVLGDLFTFDLSRSLQSFLWAAYRPIGEIDAIKSIAAPIGLSYATFRALDLLTQVYIGARRRSTLLDTLYFGLFPPSLAIGPIFEHREIDLTLDRPPQTLAEDLRIGIRRILYGCVKIFFLALPLKGSTQVFARYPTLTGPTIIGMLIAFAWYFYFNFSGYSDLAVGSARLLGHKIAENFDFPYFKATLPAFWASWHMSLSRFAQRNIFIPLGGFRRRSQYFATVITMLVIALWHDITWSMVLFGLYHGFGLCGWRLWQAFQERRAKGSPRSSTVETISRLGGIAMTHAYVVAGYPLLFLDLKGIGAFYGRILSHNL